MFMKRTENASLPLRQQVTNNDHYHSCQSGHCQTARTVSTSLYIISNTAKLPIFQTDHYVLNEAVRFVCANHNDVMI